MDNIFIEEKLLPRLTFNPGLAFEQPGRGQSPSIVFDTQHPASPIVGQGSMEPQRDRKIGG